MIFDLHNDFLTCAPKNEVSLESYCGDNRIIFALWTTQLNGLAKIPAAAEHLAIEDMGFIGGEAELEQILRDGRFRYCGLTWNSDNALAGGAMGKAGLTEKGKRFIKALNTARVPLDLAHLNEKSFFDCIGLADRVLVSHTALRHKCDHPRCLTDSQVGCVLARRGVIGLSPVEAFIGGNDIKDFADAIDDFAQSFGASGLCIGTDFYGTKPLSGLEDYDKFKRLQTMLFARGFTDTDVQNIFYNNANNFFT